MSPPDGVIEVLERFPDEAVCRQHVFDVLVADNRWRCQACAHSTPTRLTEEASAVCAACGNEQPLTAGTWLEGSKWTLQTWIVAAHLMEAQPALPPLRLARLLKQPPAEAIPWARQVQAALADPHGRRLLGLTDPTEQ